MENYRSNPSTKTTPSAMGGVKRWGWKTAGKLPQPAVKASALGYAAAVSALAVLRFSVSFLTEARFLTVSAASFLISSVAAIAS